MSSPKLLNPTTKSIMLPDDCAYYVTTLFDVHSVEGYCAVNIKLLEPQIPAIFEALNVALEPYLADKPTMFYYMIGLELAMRAILTVMEKVPRKDEFKLACQSHILRSLEILCEQCQPDEKRS